MVAALRRRLPRESILYLGDTARLPYGSKSPDTVLQYTRKNLDFLLGRGVKAVVIACNTASALALPRLGAPPVPTWGVVEPGARRAAAVSAGRVGVIATASTVRSDAYRRALLACRPGLEVRSLACPLFVPLVEEGWHDDPIAEQVARRYLEPLLAAGVDTLLLGCTHYPLLAPVAGAGGRRRGDPGRLGRGGRRRGRPRPRRRRPRCRRRGRRRRLPPHRHRRQRDLPDLRPAASSAPRRCRWSGWRWSSGRLAIGVAGGRRRRAGLPRRAQLRSLRARRGIPPSGVPRPRRRSPAARRGATCTISA